MHRLQELVRLYRMGESERKTVKLLKMGPNTARRYREALMAAGLLDGPPDVLPELEALKAAVERYHPARPPPQQRSSIDVWREPIAQMLVLGAGPTAIFDRLRLEHPDFKGSLGAVKRLCRQLVLSQGVRAEDVAIPVLTGPGEVAQVDFGEVGRLYDPEAGVLRTAYVFVMVLGFSRHMFAKVVFDQKLTTWLTLHVEAFRAFGGVPETLVPDNLKAAVVRAAFAAQHAPELNRSYRELARFYGCKIDPTPPRQPEKKGKVEAGVRYVKSNFFRPRQFSDIDEANAHLVRWVQEIAGTRLHGATRQRPRELFEQQERPALKPLPVQRFEPVVWKQVTVHRDSHVEFEGRLYSAPFKYIGTKLWVRASSRTLELYADDVRIHTHDRVANARYITHPEHLPVHRLDLSFRSRAHWEERADRLGEEVGAYIREVFDSDDVLSQLRTVQAMVRYLETVPKERANAACQRARYYGNYTYPGLKGILLKGLDLVPPAKDLFEEHSAARLPYRFARTLTELFGNPQEVAHESH
jgi:transposase